MVSIIKNEQELENVVGGKIKTEQVVGIVCGVVGVAALVVAGKFVYDVYKEYSVKTNASGDLAGALRCAGSWIQEGADAVNIKRKTSWGRAVSSAANYLINNS